MTAENTRPATPSGLSTRAVHAGESRQKPYGSLTTPIIQTSTYTFENSQAVIAHMQRKMAELPLLRGEYGRYTNPTRETVERKLAELDGCEDAVVVASGMAAITMVFLTLLSAGDHLIITEDCYRKTREFALTFLRRLGIEVSFVPVEDLGALEASITPRTRLIFTELPTNPYLRVVDLPRLVEIARRHGCLLVVDSTFATPCNIRPADYGADLVIHSGTKYLGGHNDLLAGSVAGPADIIHQLKDAQNMLGPTIDPHAAYLLLRGIKTLSLRVLRHNENGQRVAEFLETHPAVRRVFYPGLPSHPDHAIAKRLMAGFGGVVSFEIEGDIERTMRFIDALKIPYVGPSLGGVESIIEQPALMSHFALEKQERERMGIKDELVRYALGIEDADDLIADLQQALDSIL
ncbi:MAG: trans-sulfuration enzyme family protein [Anaerolineae bacterium]